MTTLDFELEVYTGKRPCKWSFIVYVTTRVLALVCIILSLVVFNVTRHLDCDAWLGFILSTAWFSAASASFLLALRGIAIWGRDMRIVVLTGSFFLANLAGLFYALNKARPHIEWSPGLQACLPSHTDQFRWSNMINFVEDSMLLAVMLLGLFRRRNATHLWELLCLQGLFWILAAVLTELPSVVLVFRNINDGWNMMFQYPHFTLMVIASSRAYRHLSQYVPSNQQPNAIMMPREHRPWENQAVAPSGRGVQVTTTIECDTESRLPVNESPPRLPSRMEVMGEYHALKLTEEEQQIRTLELQMKQDLDI